MSNAPFSDHLQVESPVDAHVRRELNFSSIYRTKQPASVPSSLKRSAKDALEELDEGDRARRRISPGMQSLPLCIPAPPRPPQLPSPKEERLCDNEDDLLERLQTSDDAFQETKEPESDQISKSADLPQATSESSHAPDQQEGSERACHALPR